MVRKSPPTYAQNVKKTYFRILQLFVTARRWNIKFFISYFHPNNYNLQKLLFFSGVTPSLVNNSSTNPKEKM